MTPRPAVTLAFLTAATRCLAQSFSPAITTGTVQNLSLTEDSGVAASRLNPNVLWTHNDSGNPADLYAMTTTGVNLGLYSVTGATNKDWEDIAVGPGPVANTQYLYVGDIGDNNANRANVSVYRVPEPAVSDTQAPVSTSVTGAAKFTFVYPDGPHDAESMFVDPLTKDIYIITKPGSTKEIFQAPYPQSTTSTTTLTLVATISDSDKLTSADISPDGSRILVRGGSTTSGRLYLRPAGTTVAQAFASAPISIPLVTEQQGEGIGFDPQGRGYYTTSEGTSQPIHYFDLLPPPAADMYWDADQSVPGNRAAAGISLGGTGSWDLTSAQWYNQSADVPWQNTHNAIFTGTPGTVTLTAPRSASSLSFKSTGYKLTGSTLTLAGPSVSVDAKCTATIFCTLTGSAGLTKSGAGTLILTAANTYTGTTTVTAGTLQLANPQALSTGPLNLSNSASVTTTPSLPQPITLPSLSIAPTATFDLTNNALQLTSAPSVDTIRSYLLNHQLTSSSSDPTHRLAYTSSGEPTAPTSLFVQLALTGDTNLNGKLDSDDYALLDRSFDKSLPNAHWTDGDFNYDGIINNQDYLLIDTAYGQAQGFSPGFLAMRESQFGPTYVQGLLASIPEPASLAACTLAAIFCRRRHRHPAG